MKMILAAFALFIGSFFIVHVLSNDSKQDTAINSPKLQKELKRQHEKVESYQADRQRREKLKRAQSNLNNAEAALSKSRADLERIQRQYEINRAMRQLER